MDTLSTPLHASILFCFFFFHFSDITSYFKTHCSAPLTLVSQSSSVLIKPQSMFISFFLFLWVIKRGLLKFEKTRFDTTLSSVVGFITKSTIFF
ncbi:hypothetical protein F5H01DRAFT_27124 [Linnemannia elongata]|nr:hypothetical protein F5H01DRAFT_27124 [Linnemannia elongata]